MPNLLIFATVLGGGYLLYREVEKPIKYILIGGAAYIVYKNVR